MSKVYEPGAEFTAVLATHKIGATGDFRILLNMLSETSEHTLAPTEHPPCNPFQHEYFRVEVIPPTQSEDLLKLCITYTWLTTKSLAC